MFSIREQISTERSKIDNSKIIILISVKSGTSTKSRNYTYNILCQAIVVRELNTITSTHNFQTKFMHYILVLPNKKILSLLFELLMKK